MPALLAHMAPQASRGFSLTTAVLACASFAVHAVAQAVTIAPNVSLSQAGATSQVLPPSFCGFGIEPSNLYGFTGGRGTNQLSINLMTTLANHTGVPPHLRIGGNSEDYFIYNSSFSGCYVQGNQNAQGQGAIAWDSQIIGPCYFTAINRFPAGTPITFGLNLAYNAPDWPQRIAATAGAAQSMLTSVELVSFEVGNEPDLYLQNGFRTGAWGGQVYTQQWLERVATVYQQILKPNNISADFFEPTCSASTVDNSFEINLIANTTSILAAAPNQTAGMTDSYIATWNQHDYYYYIGVSDMPLTLDILMNLETTYSQFGSWAQQVQEALQTGHPYALREMGSAGPNGITGISDVFGATLWTLNFFLYAATLNISSVELHMTVDSYAAAWLPTTNKGVAPHVRTTYYAYSAMTQIIGGGCKTRVGPLAIPQYPQGYSAGRLTGYVSYVGENLSSIILINTQVANSTNPSIPSVNITISLPTLVGRTFFLSYLTAAGADSMYNTTWNGVSYEQDSTGMPTSLNQPVQSVVVGQGGTFTVPVRDSQAVVATLDQQLGTGPNNMYDQAACEGLASSGVVASEFPIVFHLQRPLLSHK